MPQGDNILSDVVTLLARPYPEASSFGSRVEVGAWMGALEFLESRLILANIMKKNAWLKAPKNIAFNKSKSNQAPMKQAHIGQARLLIEQEIAYHASKSREESEPFPFREILSDLIRFKSELCEDPALKMLFERTSQALVERDKQEMPELTVIPTDPIKQRAWYKYYGFYKALLEVIDMTSAPFEKIKFSSDWFKEDELVVILFYAYSIKSNQKKSKLPLFLRRSGDLLTEHPTLKSIFNAMSVFVNAAD